MKKAARILLVAVLLVACVFTVTVAADSGAEEANPSKMFATFWALVPPIIAIGLALITKEVYSSLFIGVLVGVSLSLLVSVFTDVSTYVRLYSVIIAFAFSVLVGVVFGYLPAKNAANLKPVDSIRYE